MRLSFWSEFSTWQERQQNLKLFSEKQWGLFVKVSRNDFNDNTCWDFFSEASALNISIRVWPLLRVEEGYWLNARSADLFIQLVRDIVSEFQKRNIPLEWISFDLETPPSRLEEWGSCAVKRQWWTLWSAMTPLCDLIELDLCKEKLRSLLLELKKQGIKSHGVALPFLLLDSRQRPWERLLGVPFHDVAWDEVSVMAYRPEFERVLGPLGPDFTQVWAKLLVEYPAQSRSIDLGEVGEIHFPHHLLGISDPQAFQKDLQAALSMGVTQVNIYSWENLHVQGELSKWTASPLKRTPFQVGVKVQISFLLLRIWTWLRSRIFPF